MLLARALGTFNVETILVIVAGAFCVCTMFQSRNLVITFAMLSPVHTKSGVQFKISPLLCLINHLIIVMRKTLSAKLMILL